MAKLKGPGPVFAFELLTTSRRWQVYAVRSVFVAGLLAGLGAVWWGNVAGRSLESIRQQVEVGRRFHQAIAATQLALALLGRAGGDGRGDLPGQDPGDAGALAGDRPEQCRDRPGQAGGAAGAGGRDGPLRRTVPVAGDAARRDRPGLGARAAPGHTRGGDPGVHPVADTVDLGDADDRGGADHLRRLVRRDPAPADLVRPPHGRSCPVAAARLAGGDQPCAAGLLAGARTARRRAWGSRRGILGLCLALSAALATLAAGRLRAAATREPARAGAGAGLLLFGKGLPGPSLDANPVLWREWHARRPTLWGVILWVLYAVLAVTCTATIASLTASSVSGRWVAAAFLNAMQVAAGMLLLSISAASALGEERVRGSLDVLLATPLSRRSIIWGKWWGTFRAVPVLAVPPGLATASVARHHGHWPGVVLVVGLVVAYGAALTSLGLCWPHGYRGWAARSAFAWRPTWGSRSAGSCSSRC